MNNFLEEECFNFISSGDKDFILAFDSEFKQMGYNFGGTIGSGYCWGKYMLIYQKTNAKSKKVFARIYLRDSSIALRLFLSGVDEHRDFIEKAPAYIKTAFTNDFGECKHCKNEKEGECRFRKTYTLDNRRIEKCNGYTFEFWDPSVDRLRDYIALLNAFYAKKKTLD